MPVIFESPGWGRVGRNDDGSYYSIDAGHALCVELAKEIERLRQELKDTQETSDESR